MSVLTTKLYLPPTRVGSVSRPRLRERLDAALSHRQHLILISAPAGYGKTTLVTDWLEHLELPYVWFSVDEGDNDPVRFLQYLTVGLAQANAKLSQLSDNLAASPPGSPESMLTGLVNDIVSLETPLLLVLDDYHTIRTPAIHNAVEFLLQHAPPNLHLILLSREDPPLSLSRLRARAQLTEIRAADLQFSVDEATSFLTQTMGLTLDEEMVRALQTRTEGWIAGLQLAGLSLQGRRDQARFIAKFTGSHHYILDYLVEQVLSRQSESVQTFLLETSILERLTGPLCDALDGHSNGALQGQAMLEWLEQADLFVIPLDDERRWYRYHHLFRDFLQARLNKTRPESISSLHRLAGEWHESHGFIHEAVRHALQTRDWAYAADVVERHGMPTLTRSEMSTVREWCAAFPEEIFRTHPMLCIIQSWPLVLGYRAENRSKVEERLQQAEQAAAALEDKQQGRWFAGQVAVVRTFLGLIPNPAADPRQELALAQSALDLLAPGDYLRSTTMLAVAYAHMALLDPQAAYNALEEARRFSLDEHNYYGVVEATFQQARLAHELGQLRRAAQICQQGQARISALLTHPEAELPAVGCLDIVLGGVLLEQDNLIEAERTLLHGLDLTGWTVNPYYRMMACVALFRLREIQGRSVEALEFLSRLEELWSDVGFCTQGLRVMHSLRTAPEDPGRLAAAATWSQSFSASLDEDMPPPGMGPLGAAEAYYLARLAWARAEIAIGMPQAALAYLGRQLNLAQEHGLTHRFIQLSLAEAQAWQAQGEMPQALAALERALTLAAPEGYVRTFVDEGEPMHSLLMSLHEESSPRRMIQSAEGQAHSHSEAEDQISLYVEKLLASFPQSGEVSGSASCTQQPAPLRPALIEPLTDREKQVMELLVQGLSNHEIAERLTISIGTVKRHTWNSYAKLGVTNRTQAILKAKELGLL